MATANDLLGTLQTHAANEVRELNDADATLKHIVTTTNAQYATDRGLLSESQREYAIVKEENAARLGALSAKPIIETALEYLNGDYIYYFSARDARRGVKHTFPVRGEQEATFRVQLLNRGTAPAPSPVVIVAASPELEIEGCEPLYHVIQCVMLPAIS